MSLPRIPLAAAVAATVLALGCSESPTDTLRRRVLQPRVSSSAREVPPHPDEYLAKMADRIPGYAGFYVRDGTLVLRVKGGVVDAARATAVRQALRADPDAGRFQHLTRLLDEAPVQFEPSRYDARELWGFRVLASQRVFRNGVHRLDLDETRGVIRLGIASAGDMEEVAARVAAAGIPSDAVVIGSAGA
ncbi:MAG: hypothetical protein OEW06_07935 [Gemmatimonadota bacterium]|nr:hypothetical protein [Gemmatimonadota bacterium]